MKSLRLDRNILRKRSFPLLLVLMILVILTVTELTNVTHFFHHSKSPAIIPTINQSESSSESINPSDQSQKNAETSKGTSSTELLSPYGALISNHRPGQNGSDLIEVSQCITTPGASCYLKFSKDGVVKTLPLKSTDSTGSVFWQWSVKDAGLTSGNWSITAVATLGSQTKSTTDQISLEVE